MSAEICLDRKRYVMAVVGWHGKILTVQRRLADEDALILADWLKETINTRKESEMRKGDKVYCRKDNKTYKVDRLSTIPVGDKDVAVIITTTGATFYHDDIFVLKRKSDGFFGWLFGR